MANDHRSIGRKADGSAFWYDPDCKACAAGHHPAVIPTPDEIIAVKLAETLGADLAAKLVLDAAIASRQCPKCGAAKGRRCTEIVSAFHAELVEWHAERSNA